MLRSIIAMCSLLRKGQLTIMGDDHPLMVQASGANYEYQLEVLKEARTMLRRFRHEKS